MPQPKIIIIHESLRLYTPAKSDWDQALPWYQNPKVMYLSEGVTNQVYDLMQIYNMYEFLSTRGELYFIQVLKGDQWVSIGDVTLWEENIPIAIGVETYWRKGIGTQVLKTLINRAKVIGMTQLNVPAIFHYNTGSQRLFESLGFKKVGENETEKSYVKYL